MAWGEKGKARRYRLKLGSESVERNGLLGEDFLSETLERDSSRLVGETQKALELSPRKRRKHAEGYRCAVTQSNCKRSENTCCVADEEHMGQAGAG